jgi:hypothetical protein
MSEFLIVCEEDAPNIWLCTIDSFWISQINSVLKELSHKMDLAFEDMHGKF